jgi:predicted phosphodiesterase
MKYAVISDIHGNREALEAVLKEIRRRKLERCLCLGDLVGYNADPGWCLEKVRALKIPTVRGNHDAAAAVPRELENFTELARQAMEWTIPRLETEAIAFLGSLTLVRAEEGITIFHSSLEAPAGWRYIFTPDEARPSLRMLETPIGFFGHSHRPGFFRLRGRKVSFLPGGKARLESGDRLLVNPGSVGQPRDRDPRAAFAVYDRDRGSVEIVRVEYPVGKAQNKIREAGLPPRLADRLALGR